MWYPSSWSDLEALIGQEESATLDFKVAPTSNEETAKDIAAMSLNGGVIVYGIEENKETRLAEKIVPFGLKGIEEKVRQVAGSRISPAPDFDVITVPEQEAATDGALVVVVPASPLAPHQASGRYPCRRGTTTDYLAEPDVERLYRQRRELVEPPSFASLLEEDFMRAPGGSTEDYGAEDTSFKAGVGYIDLVVRPASRSAIHPGGAWQGRHLDDAVRAAVQRQSNRYANVSLIHTFDSLSDWRPFGAIGWTAGYIGEPNVLHPEARFAATLAYPARLSFEAALGLVVGSDGGDELYRTAREWSVAGELMAMLAIAGEYFSNFDGAGLLFVGVWLRGFQDTKSERSTRHSRRGAPFAHLPSASEGVRAEARAGALDLRDHPERTARVLIERWLPSFYQAAADLFDWLLPTP